MEEVLTTQIFYNIVCPHITMGCDNPISSPLDKVSNLEFFIFEKQWKKVIRHKNKIRRIILDFEVVLTTKTMVMDTRKLILFSYASVGLAIAQDNVHKLFDIKNNMKEYERKVTLSENQVIYYKSSKYKTSYLIDYALNVKNELNNVSR